MRVLNVSLQSEPRPRTDEKGIEVGRPVDAGVGVRLSNGDDIGAFAMVDDAGDVGGELKGLWTKELYHKDLRLREKTIPHYRGVAF